MTQSIRQLPETVADQIAAGEVVERPASVVKELIENAIDAGADQVDVEFEGGGIDAIEVRDDGRGIPREQLPLAVQRHATSKIESADDLRTVQTLGFRGEALASIASVSDLRIVSRTEEHSEGSELTFEDGEPSVKPAARAVGTTVRIENLFESVPARRKFLKTERTERKHILREVRRKSLAYPSIHFRLYERDEELLNVPPGSLEDRVYETLGEDIGETMLNVERLAPDFQGHGRFGLTGLISDGDLTHSNRRHQFSFVNSRAVRDPVLYRAVGKAYEKMGIRDGNPPVVLFLSLPSELVDVNVHPRKEEIRHKESQSVFRFVYDTVKETLQDHYQQQSAVELSGPEETKEAAEGPSGDQGTRRETDGRPSGRDDEQEPAEPELSFQDESDSQTESSKTVDRVLGQFRETFLVVEREKGLFLVDQHTAHERVLYEQYRDQIEDREPAQYLSVPLTMELEPSDRDFLLDESSQLEDLGITIEEFGGGTLAVQSVPGYLGRRADDKRMIYDILEELLEMRDRDVISDPADDLITIMACRSAVMRGDRLMPREQNELLDSLGSLNYPARCPHGRRIFYNITNETISDWFQRPEDDLCAGG
jgi:DNA mismatch repair protein MutL